jgi:hypothetical protein
MPLSATNRAALVRALGLCGTAVYASVIAWIYLAQPGTLGEVTGGLSSAVGAYRIDRPSFEEGVRLFRQEKFEEARAAFARADPARQDATTHFYVAYSYYRQGWGRVYSDDPLFRQGLQAVDRALAVAPGGRISVADASLGMSTGDELRSELVRGLTRDASDLNPLKVFQERK